MNAKYHMRHTACAAAAALATLLTGYPAVADDTELFVSSGGSFDASDRPNVFLLLDTSTSMQNEVLTQEPYDPQKSYDGTCSDNRVYWRGGTGDPPLCDTNNWMESDSLVCDAALTSFALGSGPYSDVMVRFDPDLARWTRLNATGKSHLVECQNDSGIHGDGTGTASSRVYAQDGDSRNPYSDDPLDEVQWGQNPTDRTYTVYSGNYLNWFYGPVTVSTRIAVMRDVATNVLSNMANVNVGIMRFKGVHGGIVLHAVEDIATARRELIDVVGGLLPDDHTTLAESLYEAGQYLAGRQVDFGDFGAAPHSVAGSRQLTNPSLYQSPVEFSCQKNHVVVLTDGRPTDADNLAEEKITALPKYGELVGAGCGEDGSCLDEMAEYLAKVDLNPDLDGAQSAITHTIGFTVDHELLASTAARGGGTYYTADDTASLTAALTNVVNFVATTQNSFTSPTISVDSFDRTRTLNDVYLTVFEPSGQVHWPGNLRKYRVATDGTLLDADGNAAIDPATGSFRSGSRSLWSDHADGASVAAGGAASRLPDPSNRSIFSFLASSSLTDPGNAVVSANGLLTAAELGIGNPGDPTRDELIDFIRGVDVTDVDDDGNRSEPRRQIGDPLHSSPVSIIYGGSSANPDVNDAVVFFSTNDGYLHAIDPATGVEKWSFVPPEFLSDQVLLFHNEATDSKHYGLDGDMQVQILADRNGIIEPALGEKVFLFFGMRRGGSAYYGLDVTIPDSPRLLWRLDGASLPGIGQSWSAPVPTRLNIQGASQNAEKLVLVIGGGYDPSQDNDSGSTDGAGNAIYIVDSESGELLWSASSEAADRNLDAMQYSFPSDLKVLDLDGDTFADRIYAADMGGQVWRFDIFNGETRSDLVNGGIIAQLGGAPLADPALADVRRFYYAPDVALVNDDNVSFLHIGIGSGHRAHPNGVLNQDRFYALRDYAAFNARTQVEYDVARPIRDDDLVDVTDDVDAPVVIGQAGWKIELRDGGWRGEKVLAEARTFNNQIFFTTFTPGTPASANDCIPSLGTNRLYVVDIFNGAPVNNLDGLGDDQELTLTDRYTEFEGSIASEAILLFPSPENPDDPDCVGDQCDPPPLVCVDLFCFSAGFGNDPVRTFWSQESAR